MRSINSAERAAIFFLLEGRPVLGKECVAILFFLLRLPRQAGFKSRFYVMEKRRKKRDFGLGSTLFGLFFFLKDFFQVGGELVQLLPGYV
jgi:hypothetical protein